MKKFFLVSMIVLGGCASAPAERVVTRTVTVTRTSYVSLAPELLPQVDAPANAASVATNGEMFRAWQHDAGQLGICKPAMDAIRRLQPNENR